MKTSDAPRSRRAVSGRFLLTFSTLIILVFFFLVHTSVIRSGSYYKESAWYKRINSTEASGEIGQTQTQRQEQQDQKQQQLSTIVLKSNVWWHKEGKFHAPPVFPLCSMDACLNFTRCEGMREPLVYTYWPGPHFFEALNGSRWQTDDPKRACLFFIFVNRNRPSSFTDLPFWGDGANHVIISFSDSWDAPPPWTVGKAMIAVTNARETILRPSFDISIPLPCKWKSPDPSLRQVHALDRKYFLTFMGTRYLGQMQGDFRSHPSFRSMHNGKDVIVLTHCGGTTNARILKEQPHLLPECEEETERYKMFSYTDTMNTTFGLAPAGRQSATYRFLEFLSVGAIPVVVADNWLKPFNNIIPWGRCLIQFPTTQTHRIVPSLRRMHPTQVELRRRQCLRIFDKFLATDRQLLRATLQSFKSNFYGAIPEFMEQLSHNR